MKKRKYTWIPDLPDHRDYKYSTLIKASLALPSSTDLRSDCSPIEDQGNLGSCTANALAGLLEYNEIIDKQNFVDLSRLFIYYNERLIEHTVRYDSGATLRDGIKSLVTYGACSESQWPYIISRFTSKPTKTCYRNALDHRISNYYRLDTLDEMRHALANKNPFVFGFMVYESFESPTVDETGKIPMPSTTEKALGGHAMCAVGYNDTDKRFLIRNSWGTDWGMNGYGTIPYDYLTNRNLSDDFWTVIL